MRGTNKVKETKRRASQRRATHKARLAALMLRAETRIAAVEVGKAWELAVRPFCGVTQKRYSSILISSVHYRSIESAI
jgi:uncharacterized protein (DUF2384 family)